jgi:hypothetical protein
VRGVAVQRGTQHRRRLSVEEVPNDEMCINVLYATL